MPPSYLQFTMPKIQSGIGGIIQQTPFTFHASAPYYMDFPGEEPTCVYLSGLGGILSDVLNPYSQ